MTKNDKGTLRVRFIPDDVYPLSIVIIDDGKNQTYLQIRQNDIDPLMACLWLPMSPSVRLVTTTGDYNVKWWNYHEVAFIRQKMQDAVVLNHEEAVELVGLVRHEMACPSTVSVSDSLAGANRRRDENLYGVFG